MPDVNTLLAGNVSHSLRQDESLQQLAELQLTGLQTLDTRIGAALAFVIESLLGQQQDARHAESTDMSRDPATHRSASGLNMADTAALNDVTQTVSAEQARKEEVGAENVKAFDEQLQATRSDPGPLVSPDEELTRAGVRQDSDVAQETSDPVGELRAFPVWRRARSAPWHPQARVFRSSRRLPRNSPFVSRCHLKLRLP